MNAKLAEFIKLNSIDEEVLLEALHRDILESILSEICEYMKSDDASNASIRGIYYRNSDNIKAAKQVVQNVCHLSLPDSDLKWINDRIMAFMKKKPQRKGTDVLRQKLWNEQKHKCCICGKEIMIDEGHVDHTVPWDYVGDELEDNYQLLCSFCNLHKSNHVALAVRTLIFGKL